MRRQSCDSSAYDQRSNSLFGNLTSHNPVFAASNLNSSGRFSHVLPLRESYVQEQDNTSEKTTKSIQQQYDTSMLESMLFSLRGTK